jgi:MFS family permease
MLVSAFGFQMLLSVVPLYAAAVGGGTGGAGLATATFMLSTVLTQVAMPKLLGRFGYRRVLVAGLSSWACRPSSTRWRAGWPGCWPSLS